MRGIIILFTFLSMSIHLLAQHETRVDSKITDVTVFLNRAQVTRTVKTRIESGKTDVIVHGLTSILDQQSVQVAGKGKFTILGINHVQNYSREINSPKLKILKDSIERVQRQMSLEQSQKEILSKEEQMLLSNQKIGGSNQNLSVAELKAMADFYRLRFSDINSQRMTYDVKIRSLQESLTRLQNQMREFGEVIRKNSSEIVISIVADAETTAELEINYVVANAGWYPVYDIRAIDTQNPVRLQYKANVFQNTGEEWRNVKLKLSTANPNLGGAKPELSTWFIDILRPVVRTARYKDKAESEIAGAVPGVAIEREQADTDADTIDAKSVAQYTSSIQTSLNTEFAISLPYTVNSSNKPTLVDIASHSLQADYLYSVSPKLDHDAFLLARITGWEKYSLLPGEANIFFEGTFIAKSYINPDNIDDTLSVSLGRDKRIVVKREKVKDYTSRKSIGSNQRDAYGYSISLRNTKSDPIKVIVEDQIPVSQNSQIEVTLNEAGGAFLSKDTGKLKWELSLKPQDSRKVEYKFEIRYPKDQDLSNIY